MKFRYKVLFINIIIITIALSVIGFFMIQRNFNLALDSQIKNTVEENNFLQSTLEYKLLDISDNSNSDMTIVLNDISKEIASGMSVDSSDIFLFYDGAECFSTEEDVTVPDELVESSVLGNKNYIITEENKVHYIYSVSCIVYNSININIVNKRNIDDIYKLLEQQSSYYSFLLIIVSIVCSVLMLISSSMLTKPIEKLNKVTESFANEIYSERADIKTNDEIGELADKYNAMADAVEHHVNELKDMVTRQEQFVADFTHEIKTPMTSIIGYADTIRSKELSRENQVIAASYIFSEGKRLEIMSKKLFDLIYVKQHSVDLLPVHSETVLLAVEESVTPLLNTAKIQLILNFTDQVIMCDNLLLQSALINIIDNARKASSPNSNIEVTGSLTNDNTYTISIQDYGIGISPEHVRNICNEFYMVDKSRSRKEGGAGLGLSLASLIFQSFEAKFEIDSVLGIGTTMTITFPLSNVPLEDNYEEE